jgi:hypothetical protein
MNKDKKFLKCVLGVIIILLLWILPATIPNLYNLIFGKNVIRENLYTIKYNANNSKEIAINLMQWLKNNVNSTYVHKSLINGPLWGLYYIENKPILFIKTNKASWVIHSKLGNCGEMTSYFVELMNAAGFKSYVITTRAEDHEWAEFYDEKGKQVIVDPSAGKFINDPFEFSKDENWSRIVKITANNSEEDVTSQYIQNLSTLNITITGNAFLIKQSKVSIKSKTLMLKYFSKYKYPREVVVHNFNENTNFSIQLGKKEDYQLCETVDFKILKFEKNDNLNLTSDQTIIFDTTQVLKLGKMKIEPWFLWLLIMIPIILCLVIITWLKERNKK